MNNKDNNFDQEKNVSVDIIIPTCQPGAEFAKLLRSLALQVMPADNIIIVNTEEEYWDKSIEWEYPNARIIHIKQEQFNHGTVRHAAACESKADILVFMTQDAVPKDQYLIKNLVTPIIEKRAEISYARQIPKEDAGLIEQFTRNFNYPETSCIKTRKDIPKMGIKTFFCSNVCAAYDRKIYDKLGGFPRPVVLNEDMILAGNAVEEGYRIAYVAEACVYHSHEYSGRQQFRRNFDIGASQAQYSQFFSAYPAESEGMSLIKETAKYICSRHKYHLLFKLVWISGWKYLGFKFGKNYKKLPKKTVMKWSLCPWYWKDYFEQEKK